MVCATFPHPRDHLMDCFRTCDIRGRYPEELNEPLFYDLGQELARQFLKESPILVGCDVRISSLTLKSALIKGLMDAGKKVLDAGVAPTPVLRFGKRRLGLAAAAIITASHNPPDENGLKLLFGRYPPNARQIRSLKPAGSPIRVKSPGGAVEHINLGELYVDQLAKHWEPLMSSRAVSASYVLDPGNGTWTLLLPMICQRLDLSATVIHAEPDGRFPGRSPDCSAPGSLAALGQRVQDCGASAGIAWDNDGDRFAICDETGRILSTDQLVLLLLPEILKDGAGEKILCDIKMSRKVLSAVEKLGGVPIVERSAHCHLETTMIREDCLFGCEYSGHFFFRHLSGADDGMEAALLMISLLQHWRKPLSHMVAELPPFFITNDLRVPGSAQDVIHIKNRLLERFDSDEITELDGIKVDSARHTLLVRPSVSERKLSFRFEGESADDLASIISHAQNLLPEYSAGLQSELAQSWNVQRLARHR